MADTDECDPEDEDSAHEASVDWPTCEVADCIGVKLADIPFCWAHSDETDIRLTLSNLYRHERLDFRGVVFSANLLQRVRSALADTSHPVALSFARCSFPSPTDFSDTSFGGEVDFSQATFHDALFDNCRFGDHASFRQARFAGTSSFANVEFAEKAGFVRAMFDGDATFDRTKFAKAVQFDGASFGSKARFGGATFRGETWFMDVTFSEAEIASSGTDFYESTFEGVAVFINMRSGGHISFERCRVDGHLQLTNVRVEGGLTLRGARVDGNVSLTQATVGQLDLSNARFGGDLYLGGMRCDNGTRAERTTFAGAVDGGLLCTGDIWFIGTTFETAQELGPLIATGTVYLNMAVFRERVLVEVSARRVTGRWARFLSGALLAVRSEPLTPANRRDEVIRLWRPVEVELDDADLSAPSIVTWTPAFPGMNDENEHTDEMLRPQVLSLARANVAGLTLSGVDLSRCRFAGAHNLDKLRTDNVWFGWHRFLRRVPARYFVEEERAWRATHSRVLPQRWGPVPGDGDPPVIHASQIAGIYRDLRKGSEGRGDEPGAADFYYGEMEMRRHAASPAHRETAGRSSVTNFGERLILTLYWMVSGYGLRAWRALTSFVLVVGLAGVAFAAGGLDDTPPSDPGGDPVVADDGLSAGLLVSARAATAVLSSPNVALTTFGAWLHIVLRLVGPVLLGLAVISIRGRVKR